MSTTETTAMKYLQVFVANIFESALSKKPILKVKWVKNNEHGILNYEKGVLINKAKSKHLFIAFYLEYTSIVITFFFREGCFYYYIFTRTIGCLM